MKRLTDVNFWNDQWWAGQRPARLRLYRDFDWETVRLLARLVGSQPARVLEIGAGGSRVLPFLRLRHGYEVCGTDFALTGCRLLRANLALVGEDGLVICEDLFHSSLPAGRFDLVYSSGLIEHFEDTRAVIAEHVRLVRPGGKLVLIVPNLEGLEGKVMQRLAPPLWARHRVFGPREVVGHLQALGLQAIRSGYLGSFFLYVGTGPEWSVPQWWPTWWRQLIHQSVRLFSGIVSFGFRLSPIRPHTRTFSTAFYAAGTKPPAP